MKTGSYFNNRVRTDTVKRNLSSTSFLVFKDYNQRLHLSNNVFSIFLNSNFKVSRIQLTKFLMMHLKYYIYNVYFIGKTPKI